MFGKRKSNADKNENISEPSVFDASLDALTADDLAPYEKSEKRISLYSIVRILLIEICIVVFVYCVWLMVYNMSEYKKADEIYSTLSNEFFDVNIDENAKVYDGVTKLNQLKTSVAIPIFSEAMKLEDSELGRFYSEGTLVQNMEFQRMKSKLEVLRSQNNDIVAFIYAENTKISYPVTRYTDNEFYLDHSFDKKRLTSGTVFMDYRNEKGLSENKNIVLYGHNMTNGSMFGHIPKFYNSEEFFNNTPIILYGFDGIYTFEVFSVYKTTSDYQYFRTAFDSGKDFISFAEEMKNNSVHQKDIEFTKDDILLTLSTCTNSGRVGRYALHAKLIRIDK